MPGLALVVVGVLVLAYVARRGAESHSAQTLDVYADLLGRVVVGHLQDAMLAKDNPRVQRELAALAEIEPIRSVRIVDKLGEVVYASRPEEIGTRLDSKAAACVACHQPNLPPARRGRSLRFAGQDGRQVYRTVQPIPLGHACLRCHDAAEGSLAGVLIADLDDEALTGGLRADTDRTVLGFGLGAVGAAALGAWIVRRQVVARLRALGHLLDLLRSGTRASVLAVAAADEIDEVTRAVQALALDLDGRLANERASRRLATVLERHPLPVVVVDAAGWIVAGNSAGLQGLGGSARSGLAGRPWSRVPGDTALCNKARSVGWAVPDAGEPGPAVAALHGGDGELVGFVEVWPEGSVTPVLVPGPQPEDPAWLCYSAVVLDALVARTVTRTRESGGNLLVFDPRLGHARRLAAELAALAQEGTLERAEVDLKSLALLALWDVQRQAPEVTWHVRLDPAQRIVGVRHHLRTLMARLAKAAAAQAGERGQVVVFTQADRAAVYVGAWAAQAPLGPLPPKLDVRGPRPGAAGPVLLDPADLPPLAHMVARSHGGAVEVDPAYPAADVPGTVGREAQAVGTLYVARLTAGRPSRPAPRGMA